jgi:hypothetical protein
MFYPGGRPAGFGRIGPEILRPVRKRSTNIHLLDLNWLRGQDLKPALARCPMLLRARKPVESMVTQLAMLPNVAGCCGARTLFGTLYSPVAEALIDPEVALNARSAACPPRSTTRALAPHWEVIMLRHPSSRLLEAFRELV